MLPDRQPPIYPLDPPKTPDGPAPVPTSSSFRPCAISFGTGTGAKCVGGPDCPVGGVGREAEEEVEAVVVGGLLESVSGNPKLRHSVFSIRPLSERVPAGRQRVSRKDRKTTLRAARLQAGTGSVGSEDKERDERVEPTLEVLSAEEPTLFVLLLVRLEAGEVLLHDGRALVWRKDGQRQSSAKGQLDGL